MSFKTKNLSDTTELSSKIKKLLPPSELDPPPPPENQKLHILHPQITFPKISSNFSGMGRSRKMESYTYVLVGRPLC